MILLVIIDFFMMKTTKSIMLVRYCNLKDFFYEKKVEQYSSFSSKYIPIEILQNKNLSQKEIFC